MTAGGVCCDGDGARPPALEERIAARRADLARLDDEAAAKARAAASAAQALQVWRELVLPERRGETNI